MNIVELSENGQIFVPAEIQELLGVKFGDKLMFYQNISGEIVLESPSVAALAEVQGAMEGVAGRLGVYDEDDVQKLVDEVRYGDFGR